MELYQARDNDKVFETPTEFSLAGRKRTEGVWKTERVDGHRPYVLADLVNLARLTSTVSCCHILPRGERRRLPADGGRREGISFKPTQYSHKMKATVLIAAAASLAVSTTTSFAAPQSSPQLTFGAADLLIDELAGKLSNAGNVAQQGAAWISEHINDPRCE